MRISVSRSVHSLALTHVSPEGKELWIICECFVVRAFHSGPETLPNFSRTSIFHTAGFKQTRSQRSIGDSEVILHYFKSYIQVILHGEMYEGES